MSHYLPIVAALVTILLITIILYSSLGRVIQDIPNERSMHAVPTPRIGGVGLMAGVLCAWVLMPHSLVWWLILPMLGLFMVSLLDDMRGLPVRWRLLAHLAAAALVIAGSGLLARYGILSAALMLLFTVWVTNLYNFMDGSDGLAGGMTFFGFSMYGAAALLGNNEQIAMLNFSVAAAAAGFLLFNFHPAKIFMGDAGSIPLGFLAAVMGLWGWQNQLWPAWFPLLVFSTFILDATVTLLKRGIRLEKIWQAHREHYYQRLLMLGTGHRNTALIEYGVMAGSGLSALWLLQHPAATIYILLIWCVVYTLAMLLVDRIWKAHQHV